MERPVTRRAVFAIGVVMACCLPSVAVADEITDEKLRTATEAFEMQDYDRTIEVLRPLVLGNAITNQTSLRLSRERLGASYWFTEATDAARLTFSTLLKANPNHRLDPLYYPQELISFFETEKKRLKDLGFIGKPSVSPSAETASSMTLVKTITERPMPTIGYLMPFGVGQFANEQVGKGTLIAVLQGVGLATNIASWIAIEAMKKPGTNLVSETDAGRAEIVGILWWIGSALFVGSYTYGVIDGFVYRPPEIDEQRHFELVDPSDAGPPPPPQPTLRLGPGPGLGVGLSGTF